MTESKAAGKPTLHVHRWGAPFTDDWSLFPLSPGQRDLLIHGCEEFESKPTLVEDSKEFKELLQQMQAAIDKTPEKKAFFRLSSTSSKDAVPEGSSIADSLCATTAQKIVRELCKSFRILEDLQEYTDCAIVLRAFNSALVSAPEYRTFVQNGKIVGVVRKADEPSKDKEDAAVIERVTKFVAPLVGKLPERSAGVDVCLVGDECVFVELNPLDEELDLFGFEGLKLD
jgi:hypothetical protein